MAMTVLSLGPDWRLFVKSWSRRHRRRSPSSGAGSPAVSLSALVFCERGSGGRGSGQGTSPVTAGRPETHLPGTDGERDDEREKETERELKGERGMGVNMDTLY